MKRVTGTDKVLPVVVSAVVIVLVAVVRERSRELNSAPRFGVASPAGRGGGASGRRGRPRTAGPRHPLARTLVIAPAFGVREALVARPYPVGRPR